ncbi:MAG: SRPBCC family protein [Steroidobacteraceae bacterium]
MSTRLKNPEKKMRLQQPWPSDTRQSAMKFFEVYENDLKAMFSERDYAATRALADVAPEGADPVAAFAAAVELGRKAAEGVGCPEGVTWEHMAKAGAHWHIFPASPFPGSTAHFFTGHGQTGTDPDRCIFDIWSLVRYAPGKEPPLERRLYRGMAGNSAGAILDQDIANMGEIQKGMKSRAFHGARPNPVQEVEIINFHETLDRYLASD